MRIVSRQPSEHPPARVRSLSVLPVFFDLRGRRTVVVGGSDAAAWKAELLVAAGAHVHVYAPSGELSETFVMLLARGTERGALSHYDRAWDVDVLKGAAMAVIDASSEEEARSFHDAAAAIGVPVNVIDRPELCGFQFGSIVNRSPVVVGISTAGAAPVLAQAIRRRIEIMLPLSLAAWARLAAGLRDAVNARLAPGSQRQAFWERFVDRAFGGAPSQKEGRALLADVDRIASLRHRGRGRVTLVGAGPGDAELLTLKAVRALQAADVILFDDLVSDEVLELARREAKRMLVGKRGSRRSCRQEEINDLMVRLAKAGKRVVRLKSGDPMIFGRAGEEIAWLEDEGIPVEVVPGITAALAMASALGFSLTHRDHARSVRFVTGHSKQGGLPDDLDWKAVAEPMATTVFYMGGRTAGRIAERLLAEGMPPTTPVAIMTAIARANEQRRLCDLAGLETAVAALADDDPILIGIGQVFVRRTAEPASIASSFPERALGDGACVG